MLNILTFTTLYPNAVKNRHGIFVETRLRHLLESRQVEARVVAPVPFFPFEGRRWGKYGEFAQIPLVEERFGIQVTHPRYPLLPKIGLSIAPFLMAFATLPHLQQMLNNGYNFDIIDAHFFYPDGVAATLLAKWLNKKVVITARGTDIHTYPALLAPRQLIRWASNRMDHSIAVCEALRKELIRLGAPPAKVTTLNNGVDLDFFCPAENRSYLRKKIGLAGNVLLSVGNLIDLKGHNLIIRSLMKLPEQFQLVIIGEGDQEHNLKNLALQLGLEKRVFFLGSMPQGQLRAYYQGADALILASSREGWANVLLESMACGTPVLATKTWGTPEVVAHPNAGFLIEKRSVDCISHMVIKLFNNLPERENTRKYAEKFDWTATTNGQINIFNSILRSS